ncbi:sensor histidine kinase [Paenibacillus sinopodophylli]|uniref:sensor histidine kinase n=1 Tax=Paenibacillus sinopodophylli TaxID=1837342 RepID=UPI00110C9A20|nr:sensor histidine kinase [Paenibacillus sinopodophylli]
MKSLYTRIVTTFILIALISGAASLFMSNFYYLAKLREINEQRITSMVEEIAQLYQQTPAMDIKDYADRIGRLGFQIYVVDESLTGEYFGGTYKRKELDAQIVKKVLAGTLYEGILQQHHALKVIGFFENSLRNSVGIPVDSDGKRYALFIRPDLAQQIGDVRLLMAFLLVVTFLLSLILIALLTRLIVRPLKKLTRATDQIIHGDYHITMDVERRDELGDLARHFTTMAGALRQVDKMRQEFVSNVSHEIQSPLTSIQGFASAIRSGAATKEEQELYLRIIEEESGRLSSLSTQLLTLASLDNEQMLPSRSTFRMDEQIRQAVIVLERQWSGKALTVELDLDEVTVSAHESQLYQVWINLLTNAIKFTPADGHITVRLQVRKEITVTVQDSGIGIANEDLMHVFERFYKANKSRNGKGKGSGLGLSIAQAIIELHQGHISIESKARVGTAVTIRLPHL